MEDIPRAGDTRGLVHHCTSRKWIQNIPKSLPLLKKSIRDAKLNMITTLLCPIKSCEGLLCLTHGMQKFRVVCQRTERYSLVVVVVRLSVHAHFNLGLSPRDSSVPGQRPSVCSISLLTSERSLLCDDFINVFSII